MDKNQDKLLKIGIIGTHEVGKTTLAHLLTGFLKAMDYKVNLVHEAARLSPFGLLNKTTMKTEMWIINQQINNELLIAEFSDIIICDRTSIDTLAYAKYVVEKNPTNENLEAFKLLNNIIDANLKSYDLFIYVPINKKIIKRRNKRHDEKFKKNIDKYLIKIIKDKKITNIHELSSKSMMGRIEEIIHVCSLDLASFKIVSSQKNNQNIRSINFYKN